MRDAMPDKDDPRYASQREDGQRVGRRVAQFLGFDRLSHFIYRHGSAHKKAFLVISFGLVGGLFLWNTINIVFYMSSQRDKPRRAVTEYVDSVMDKGIHKNPIVNE